ncbi:hypothetical protein KC19_3G027500 [Ceratodon purpureus]|uniref:Uncharacterized protein n=1 Tax=Ceratodon purpureus TaxID=3225 RepID=A0A8T0IG84_CERPU|nr:hypothetical protein KC19_3G027500 [Ceratodon purpureus]
MGTVKLYHSSRVGGRWSYCYRVGRILKDAKFLLRHAISKLPSLQNPSSNVRAK